MLKKETIDQIQKYVYPFRITRGKGFQLNDFDPADACGLKLDKGEAAELLAKGTAWRAEEQEIAERLVIVGAGVEALILQLLHERLAVGQVLKNRQVGPWLTIVRMIHGQHSCG